MTKPNHVGGNDPFLFTSGAARTALTSEATIRASADRGDLPCVRSANGTRLFKLSDVLAFKERLEQRGPSRWAVAPASTVSLPQEEPPAA